MPTRPASGSLARVKSLVATVVASLLLLLPAACGGDDAPSAEELVAQSSAATELAKTFHFVFDVQGVPETATGIQLQAAEGDVVVPDRVAADVSGRLGPVPLQTQLVAIGEEVWIKNPLRGSWEQVDVGTTPGVLLDPATGVLGVMQDVTGLEEAEPEQIGGVPVRVLRGSASAKAVGPLVAVSGGGGDVDVTLWIGEEDKLLRRVQVDGAVADGEPDRARRVVDLSRFDAPVTIAKPEAS